MAQSVSVPMCPDDACSGPGGLTATDRTVSSSRSTPTEEATAPGTQRTSLGPGTPLCPANPCWALDMSGMICPSWKGETSPPRYVQVDEGHFGGYSWPRVVPPPQVFGIWKRCATDW
ncbi:hypothetical protein Vretimale_595 [Volvox reticuliferus]|uniref:Uncharacterized protein n=1 Tax=Volvox reticuliferus TaxID=1737510 RepID=A0A8J4FDM9_9CHLO|nr:hypothetical protein Vretifemale_2396 [Volvox reticuliferus]GIL94375.1 hypothetical protein Vretimale_595 [Volvox reticuliferus]